MFAWRLMAKVVLDSHLRTISCTPKVHTSLLAIFIPNENRHFSGSPDLPSSPLNGIHGFLLDLFICSLYFIGEDQFMHNTGGEL
jgi:hypothetical protein